MRAFLKRNPRKVITSLVAAIVIAAGVGVFLEALAPKVGRASTESSRTANSLANRIIRLEMSDNTDAGAVQPSSRKTLALDVAEPAVGESPDDRVQSTMSEVRDLLELCGTPLSTQVLEDITFYENGADIVETFLHVTNAVDESRADSAVPLGVRFASALFRAMSLEDLQRLEPQVPNAERLSEAEGLYLASCTLYLTKAHAELSKASGDTTAEMEYRQRFADATLEMVNKHFEVPEPFVSVYLIELLREYRDATLASANPADAPALVAQAHEMLLTAHPTNVITWALQVWLAHYYHTDGRDRTKALAYAEAALQGIQIASLDGVLNDSNIDAPSRVKLEMLLGRALHFAGRFEEAQRQFEAVLERYPSDPRVGDAAYFRAMALCAASKFQDADSKIAFLEFLGSFPSHRCADRAWLSLSNLYLADGDFAAAEETLRQITDDAESNDVEDNALAQLAMVLDMRGDTAGAMAAYERLLHEYAESSRGGEVLTRLSHARVQAAGVEAGIRVYDDYLMHHPDGTHRELAQREKETLKRAMAESVASDAVVDGAQ